MHIQINTSFLPYQLPEELIRVKFDEMPSWSPKMNLFGVFVCALFVAEGWAARYPSLCPQIRIKYGRVRYKARGRIARILCNTGYILAGDKYSTCDVSGKWDTVTFPKCVRPTCKAATPPKNGLIFPSHRGAVLNFYCTSGFQLKGAMVSYCDGYKWDNPLPTCLASNTTAPLSCDFEQEDLCGWNHDLNHDFDWRRMNYATPSGHIGTGPSYDHTKGAGEDGYYMYIESSARNINDTARLISPVYDKSNTTTCFEFFYHMYGATTGSLRVYLKKVNETFNLTADNAVFVKNGNQGNKWYRGLIVLGEVNDEYQIIIEGVRGSSYVSDIAIDDVRIIKDCVPENEQGDGDTTTEETFSSEPPINVESCENRCNTNDTNKYAHLLTCDCDERCFERHRCCLDYFDFCLAGTGTDFGDETTEPYSTEAGTTILTTTIQKRTTTTTTIPKSTTTIPKTTTTVPKNTIKLTIKPKITTTRLTTYTIRTTTKPTTEAKPITASGNSYTKSDVAEVPRVTIIEVETPAPPIKETKVTKYYHTDKSYDHQKIEVSSNISESNMKTIVFGVGVVFGVLFALVGMTFVARRYQLCRCNRLSLNQSSNGDSASDVRFLTSDEIIDFTLASDYDTL